MKQDNNITIEHPPGFIWGKKWEVNYFRKCFWVRKKLKIAEIKIFVDTGYELFLNEQFVGSAQGFLIIKKFNVIDKIHNGKNVVAIKAVNHGGHKGLVAELCLEYYDGDVSLIKTNSTWKTVPGEKWGWKKIDFDDSTWEKVKIVGEKGREPWKLSSADKISAPPGFKKSPFYTKVMKKTACRKEYKDILDIIGQDYKDNLKNYPREVSFPETIKDINSIGGTIQNTIGATREGNSYAMITVNKKNGFACITVDFGKEVIGYLRFKIESPSVCNIHLLFGETIAECYHEPPPDNLLSKMVVEDITLEPGRHEWEDSHRQGFRFVRISFGYCSAPVKIGSISVRHSLYPVEYTGYFSCSDKLLNRIWEIGRYTVHLCMQEYYLDGIKRDRLSWIGDTWLESLVNYYAFGDGSLFKYNWYKYSQVQFRDGAIPAVLGEGAMIMWDYVAWWIISLYDYYIHTGDKDYIKTMDRYAIKAAEWLVSKMDGYNLIYVPKRISKHQCPPTLARGQGEELNLNVLFHKALLCMSKIMEVVNDKKRVKRYELISMRVKEAVNRRLWSNLKGRYFFCRDGLHRYDDSWQEGNAMAVHFGLVGSERANRILKVQKHKRGARLCPSEWPFLIFNEVEALFKIGAVNDALELIKHCWGNLVERGATTFWETIDLTEGGYKIDEKSSWKGYNTRSHCHGWSAGPTYSLQANVLGITPLSPGFTTFRVVPRLGSLRWAKGVVPSPFGLIAASHMKKLDGIHTTLLLPKNTVACLVLPKPTCPHYRIMIDGKVIYTVGKMLNNVSGLKDITIDDKNIHLNLSRSGKITVSLENKLKGILRK